LEQDLQSSVGGI